MSGSDDDTLACGIFGGVDKISSNNKTCTSCAQKVEHCKKEGAGENGVDNTNNNISNNTDVIGSDVSKELDSVDTSIAFTFLPPESAKSEDKTKSNTKNEIFQFGPARNNSVSNNIDKIVEDVGKLVVSDVDDKLFQHPPPKEDCPICMLPMPFDYGMYGVSMAFQACCGKLVCTGCILAAEDEMKKGTMKELCLFCRVPVPTSYEELEKRNKKRMSLNDAEAFYTLGAEYERGSMIVQQNTKKAVELWKQGAELGSLTAIYQLGVCYFYGKGVEKDENKAIYHWKVAAIGGHERARYYLGALERDSGNMNVAMKHFMIAAKSGYDDALKMIRKGYEDGLVTKDEYAIALRANKDSQDEMKSTQRAIAAARFPQTSVSQTQ